MRQVVPLPIWIGHAGDGRDHAAIQAAGLRALVQLAIEEPGLPTPRDLIAFRIPLFDGPGNPPEVLGLAIRLVADLLGRRIPTLVCCGAGMSRSPSILAAAMAIRLGESPETALARVLGSGPRDVSPGLWNDVLHLLRAAVEPRDGATSHPDPGRDRMPFP